MDFNIIYLPKIDSTNSYAQKQIEKKALKEGDVIFTLNQEEGKGHGNNNWESEPNKNLLASIILEPTTIEAANQFVLTQIISLAITDLLKEYITTKNQQINIKWPNDIYVGEYKIAGILFQNFIKGNIIEHSIVGIGINVNQTKFISTAPNPISLIHYTNNSTNINKLLQKLLKKISIYYEKYTIVSNHKVLKTNYINMLYRYNSWANYADSNGNFRGKIEDIDQYGRLIIKLENGIEKTYAFKEIRFIN